MWPRGPAARRIAGELMRCGPSIGANAEEAQDGQTKPDFIAKLAISRKEARETRYWLKLAIRTGTLSAAEAEPVIQEVTELRRMIMAAIKTAQSNRSRAPAL